MRVGARVRVRARVRARVRDRVRVRLRARARASVMIRVRGVARGSKVRRPTSAGEYCALHLLRSRVPVRAMSCRRRLMPWVAY